MKAITERRQDILFIVLLLAISLIYNYQHILFLRPESIHQWRQCDCLSITLNYFKEGMHFFVPTVHWCGLAGDGRTATSELPWLYYAIAALWKVFGYHEFIYRLVDVLIAYAGLIALYKIIEKVLSDNTWAMIITLFVFASPIYAYYANNFLSDVPSFSLALIAWYFFVKYYYNGKALSLVFSMLFFMIAGFTKISALISFVPIVMVYLLETFNIYKFKGDEPVFKNKVIPLALFIIMAVPIILWTNHEIFLNETHNTGLFSIGTLPIWHESPERRRGIYYLLKDSLRPEFCNTVIFDTVIILFCALIVFYRKVNALLLFLTISVFIGAILYVILWYGAMTVHDYYLLNLLIVIPITFVTFLHTIKRSLPGLFQSRKLKWLCALFLGFSIYNTCLDIRERYEDEPLVNHAYFKPDINGLTGLHSRYDAHLKALETITPYLRTLGIERNDKVISVPDVSINISLYLMDQKGFSQYGYDFNDTLVLKDVVKLGAKYLIVNDTTFSVNIFRTHLGKRIGNYKNVVIYALKS